jgi:hypothetical protein
MMFCLEERARKKVPTVHTKKECTQKMERRSVIGSRGGEVAFAWKGLEEWSNGSMSATFGGKIASLLRLLLC